MKRSIRHLVVPLILALVLSGCSNWIIGDSITDMSRAHILKGNPTTNIDSDPARGAYTFGWKHEETGWSAVLAHVNDVPVGGWLVVELGTNDLDRPATEWKGFVDDVVALLPDDRCLAWVTPYMPDHQSQSDAYIAVMRTELRGQPCRAIIHWDEVAQAYPWLTKDGYHPSDAGSTALACMINSVLYQSCTTALPITRD